MPTPRPERRNSYGRYVVVSLHRPTAAVRRRRSPLLFFFLKADLGYIATKSTCRTGSTEPCYRPSDRISAAQIARGIEWTRGPHPLHSSTSLTHSSWLHHHLIASTSPCPSGTSLASPRRRHRNSHASAPDRQSPLSRSHQCNPWLRPPLLPRRCTARLS